MNSKHLRQMVVVLAVVALGSLVASPTQAATKKKPVKKPPVQTNWRTYTDMSGSYKVNYPPSWQVLTKGNALVITSPGGPDDRGVFGITPRAEGISVEEAVNKEFQDPDHSADLQKFPARLGGLVATKVVGSKKGDPNIRVVEYYVQKGSQQYYILFQAPHAAMDRYSSVFNAMITSMKFLN